MLFTILTNPSLCIFDTFDKMFAKLGCGYQSESRTKSDGFTARVSLTFHQGASMASKLLVSKETVVLHLADK